MFVAKPSTPQSDPPHPPKEKLPTMYDLPSEFPEEPGLPDQFHDLQPDFLRLTLKSRKIPPERMFIGTNINIYYDVNHPLWHKRPDWFVAVGVPRLYDGTDLRRSYVVWQEEVSPLVIVELLSPGTAKEDLGENAEEEEESSENGNPTEGTTETPPSKWEVYEQILRVPYYVVFDRYTDRLRFFKLEETGYQEQKLNDAAPQIWIPELELGLGLWDGESEGVRRLWLRWCDVEGNWIPTPAEEAQQRAEAAERAQREAIPKLLGMGLAPEQVAEALGLPIEDVNREMQE